jgi:uncharacterized protein (TIGR00369 family)
VTDPSADAFAALPDLAQVVAAFASIPHCRLLGMRLDEVRHAYAAMSLAYDERFVGNWKTGVLHGGVVTVLLDTLCGLAVMSAVPEGTPLATLDLRIDYLRPAAPGRILRGTAECYKLTPNIAFARGIAFHDSADQPIAHGTGTFMLRATGFAADVRNAADAKALAEAPAGGQPC